MFDSVKCYMPLPPDRVALPGADFQTKAAAVFDRYHAMMSARYPGGLFLRNGVTETHTLIHDRIVYRGV